MFQRTTRFFSEKKILQKDYYAIFHGIFYFKKLFLFTMIKQNILKWKIEK